jgi:hypothetical protein
LPKHGLYAGNPFIHCDAPELHVITSGHITPAYDPIFIMSYYELFLANLSAKEETHKPFDNRDHGAEIKGKHEAPEKV